MKKLSTVLLLAVAPALALSACTKDDEAPKDPPVLEDVDCDS